MKTSIHYLTDEAGNTTAVQIPIQFWKMYFQEAYERFVREESEPTAKETKVAYKIAGKKHMFTPEEVEFAEGLKEAFKDAKAMSEQEKDFQTLDDFLDKI